MKKSVMYSKSDTCETAEVFQLLLPPSNRSSSNQGGSAGNALEAPALTSESQLLLGVAEKEKLDGLMDYQDFSRSLGRSDNDVERKKLMTGEDMESVKDPSDDLDSCTNKGFQAPETGPDSDGEGVRTNRDGTRDLRTLPPQPSTEMGGGGTDGGGGGGGGDDDSSVTATPMQNPISSQHSASNGDLEPNVDPQKYPQAEIKGSRRRQVFAALGANMGAMALGSVASWTATALPDLRRSGAIGTFTQTQESWIGSIMTLGAILSCPVAGVGIERLGRRMTMLLLTPPFLTGWLVIYFAQDLAMIYVGRFITGFCGGAFTIAAPVFITETAEMDIRGALASGFDMMITVGILYIFIVGTYASWRVQALSCGLIPLVFHALMFFVPESPRYLLERRKEKKAAEALAWFRAVPSSHSLVQEELTELRKSVEDSRERAGSWRDLLALPVIRPTSICLALMFFQQLSGIDAVMFYTVDIFHSAGSDVDENLATNIVGSIQVAATVTAALVVDRSGRRLLLLLSAVFMVISLGSMGLYFYMKSINGGIPPENLGWLPLSSLMVYVVAFSIGFGPIPWLMLGELIPSHVKGLAAGIVTVARWILGFVVTLGFQDVMDILGEHGGYWLLAGFCLLGTFFVFFFVPETKGKSMDEIQAIFNPAQPLEHSNTADH